MGVEIKLTDNQLPVSPVFIDFLLHIVEDIPFEGAQWGDQLSEVMLSDQRRIVEQAPENAKRVLAQQQGQAAIGRAYKLLLALLTGDVDAIKDIQLKFHFVNVIGIPRNGMAVIELGAPYSSRPGQRYSSGSGPGVRRCGAYRGLRRHYE